MRWRAGCDWAACTPARMVDGRRDAAASSWRSLGLRAFAHSHSHFKNRRVARVTGEQCEAQEPRKDAHERARSMFRMRVWREGVNARRFAWRTRRARMPPWAHLKVMRAISAMAVEAEVVVGSSARSIGKSMVVVAMSATRASGASPLVARRVWRAENRRWT